MGPHEGNAMRLFVLGLLLLSLASSAGAQWYPPPPYYAPYPYPVVAYPPPMPVPSMVVDTPPPMIVEYPQPFRYYIAFNDGTVLLADTYWVNGNTLWYVTTDHRLQIAPLIAIDRITSEQLNRAQQVSFFLPPSPGPLVMRRTLEQQLGLVFHIRETPRGIMLNISDVLFGFDRHLLTIEAREKLSKVTGILLAYGGLSVHLDGYTDNVGGEEYNLLLSQQRANAVMEYLISQGLPSAEVTATGFGKANPVASNSTVVGRQQNRRVEMLISGEMIGITTAWVIHK